MSAVELYLWGQDWSPLVVAETGTVMTFVYYPHKKTPDIIITMRGHPVHCMICMEDIPRTKPRTRRRTVMEAVSEHLKAHGRRTRKRNKSLDLILEPRP